MPRTSDAQGYEQALRVRVGTRLRVRRVERKQSQMQVVVALDGVLTQASMSNYESGKRTLPLHVAVQLAEYLGLTIEELVA